MDRIVFRKNNSLNYKGYLPEKIQLIVDNKNKILKLKRELKILINNENFTRASEVRDEINELRKMNKLYKEEI